MPGKRTRPNVSLATIFAAGQIIRWRENEQDGDRFGLIIDLHADGVLAQTIDFWQRAVDLVQVHLPWSTTIYVIKTGDLDDLVALTLLPPQGTTGSITSNETIRNEGSPIEPNALRVLDQVRPETLVRLCRHQANLPSLLAAQLRATTDGTLKTQRRARLFGCVLPQALTAEVNDAWIVGVYALFLTEPTDDETSIHEALTHPEARRLAAQHVYPRALRQLRGVGGARISDAYSGPVMNRWYELHNPDHWPERVWDEIADAFTASEENEITKLLMGYNPKSDRYLDRLLQTVSRAVLRTYGPERKAEALATLERAAASHTLGTTSSLATEWLKERFPKTLP